MAPEATLPSSLNVGIIRTSSLGDVILATSCLDIVSKISGTTSITWIGRNPSLSLITQAFPDLKSIELTKQSSIRQILQQLESVDILIDLQANLRSRIICHAFKRKYRRKTYTIHKNQITRNKAILESRVCGRSRPLSKSRLAKTKPFYQVMTETMALALTQAKVVDESTSISFCQNSKPRIPYFPAEILQMDKHKLPPGKFLALAPGAKHATKQSPVQTLGKIVDLTIKQIASKNGGQRPFHLVLRR